MVEQEFISSALATENPNLRAEVIHTSAFHTCRCQNKDYYSVGASHKITINQVRAYDQEAHVPLFTAIIRVHVCVD